jgi:TonB family protein
MSPRSLLFSSDQETSRLLCQALQELEFEVEICPEIFAAVERITTQSFELIVGDWDGGLEASFLLKTTRELKINSSAVTVAVVADSEAAGAARQVGAAIILNKPVVPEQAKYTLLSADVFLRGMRVWMPKLMAQRDNAPVTSKPGPQLVSPPHENPPALPKGLGIAPVPNARFWPRLIKRDQTVGKPRSRHWIRLISLACMLGVALSSAGYVFSAPLHSQEIATSVEQIYEKAVIKTHTWLVKSREDGDDGSGELAQNTKPTDRAITRIRVTPVHEYSEPAPKTTLTQVELPPTNPQPKPEYPSIAVASIPDSLRGPAQSLRSAAARVTPSLLGGLEPVNLSEDLASKLLLARVEPSYPKQALQAGLQGPVVLQAWIARDGSIRDLKLIRGSLLLGQAAYSAVRQWKYKPYLLNGQAVETQTYVTVNFTLP